MDACLPFKCARMVKVVNAKKKNTRISSFHTYLGGRNKQASLYYVPMQMGSFYTLPPDGQYGSASYITRAVVNRMLHEGLRYDSTKNCTIS